MRYEPTWGAWICTVTLTLCLAGAHSLVPVADAVPLDQPTHATLINRVLAGQRLQRQQWTQTEGLSHALAHAMLQDRQGFVWIGTGEGLNRFDGHRIRTFARGLNPQRELQGSQVVGLLEDPQGILWMLMGEGILSRFDPASETFQHFPLGTADRAIRAQKLTLVREANNTLVFGSNHGPWRFDPQQQRFSALAEEPDYPDTPAHRQVLALTVAPDDLLLVGTGGGLIARSPDGDWRTLLEGFQVKALAPASEGWWVGTGEGLLLLNQRYQVLRRWRSNLTDNHLNHDNVVSLKVTDSSAMQGVWVGTQTGLNLVLQDTGQVFNITDIGTNATLQKHQVDPLLIDHEGALWSALRGTGIVRLNAPSGVFTHYALNAHNTKRENQTPVPVLGLGMDSRGTLWIGSWGNGLYKLPPGSDRPQIVPSDIPGKAISWIVEDTQGQLWVASFDRGLSRWEPGKRRFTRIQPGANWPDPSPVIQALALDQSDTLWIGTETRGLYRYRPTDAHSAHYTHHAHDASSLSSNQVMVVYQDRSDTLWVGTDNGLNRYRDDSDDFQRFIHDPDDATSISDNFVKAILEDRQGRLWVATNLGLNRLNPDTGRFQVYTIADGLPHNRVNNLIQDQLGFLWLGTANGLSHFDPDSNRFDNFSLADGLPGRLIFYPAVTASADGTLYFGGPEGLVSVDPQDFGNLTSRSSLPPVLTGVRLFNRPLPIATGTRLPHIPQQLKELTLSYQQDMLSLEFIAPEFSTPQQQRYRYRLEGMDSTWLETPPGEHSATYTGLDPGYYRFQVQAAIGDGPWEPPPSQMLAIRVTPPWWATLWFRGLLLIVVASLLMASYRWRTWTINRRNQYLQQQVRQRTRELAAEIAIRRRSEVQLQEAREAAESASHAKSLFLATMSHELRTPLNNILGFTRLLTGRRVLDPEQQTAIDSIQHNAQHLFTLIKDILDVTRIEANRLSLRPGIVHLDQLLSTLISPVELRGRANQVTVCWEIASLPSVITDAHRLRQILDNLLDNALKYTDHGEVMLSIQRLANDGEKLAIRFQVRDTGIGIPAQHLRTVLQLFEQAHDSTHSIQGVGLGLYLCKRLVALLGGELHLQSRVSGSDWASTANNSPPPPPQPHGTLVWFDLWLMPVGDPALAAAMCAPQIDTTDTQPLQFPPPEVLAELQTILASGDIRALIARSEALLTEPEHASFLAQVLTLSREFKLNELQRWFDQYPTP